MTKRTRYYLGIAIFIFAMVVVALVVTEAESHSFYDPACCSDRDCYVIQDDAVQFTATGWQIVATGETIPFSKTRVSADDHFHRCSSQGSLIGHTICLYAPPGGV